MSFAGFKKQINKANQFMSEKIGGAKGTELDDDFYEMEKKIDAIGKLVDEVMTKTQELLQPNPASRAKLMAMKQVSKVRGQAYHNLYPQPEGLLGECMLKHGKDIGDDSIFGQALIETGDSFKQLAEAKYAREETVNQDFIFPLNTMQNKDLKEVNHHRKKLEGRRLDFDCKKRKQMKDGSTVTDEELRIAEEKFVESKELAETAMNNLLENDVEQVSQLSTFVEAELAYHQRSLEILESLSGNLKDKIQDALSRPRSEHVPKRMSSSRRSAGSAGSHDMSSYSEVDAGYRMSSSNSSPQAYHSSNPGELSTPYDIELVILSSNPVGGKPCAEALYDFEPENAGELGFREGDMINLISRIDENWYEGSLNGQTGYFPVTYVKVLVDCQ